MLSDNPNRDFFKQLVLASVPALIGIIPETLRLVLGEDEQDKKPETGAAGGNRESFASYVASRKKAERR